MSRSDRPLLAEFKDALGTLTGELRQMVALRWHLARLELESDTHLLRRTSLVGLAAAMLVQTALPLLAVGLAQAMEGRLGLSFTAWLLIFALALLAAGAGLGRLAWVRFRQAFTGLRQTREELREDLLWLDEWLGPKR